MNRQVVAVLAVSILSSTAPAQSRSIVGAVGAQYLRNEGAGLSLLAGLSAARSVFVASLPLELTILPNNDSRYQTDTFSNGQSRCRDTTNGQFADSSLCGPRTVLGASLDVLGFRHLDATHAFGIGGGYRVGPANGPFAVTSLVFGQPSGVSWNVKVRAGASLLELSVGGALPWR